MQISSIWGSAKSIESLGKKGVDFPANGQGLKVKRLDSFVQNALIAKNQQVSASRKSLRGKIVINAET